MNNRAPKFKAILKTPGPLPYPPVYRITAEAAINNCYETAKTSESPYTKMHGHTSCTIELWERVPSRSARTYYARTHYEWVLHSTYNVYGTRYLSRNPQGREFGGELPLPKAKGW